MIMPFGKYKGIPVAKVPSDYLAWCLRECTNLNQTLRTAIVAEVRARRKGAGGDKIRLPHPNDADHALDNLKFLERALVCTLLEIDKSQLCPTGLAGLLLDMVMHTFDQVAYLRRKQKSRFDFETLTRAYFAADERMKKES